MDQADEMLLTALGQSGLKNLETIEGLSLINSDLIMKTALAFVNVVSGKAVFDEHIPQETSLKFRLCSNLVIKLHELGFREELNFHHFLYPSEMKTRQLLRFFVGALSVQTPVVKSKRKSRVKQKVKVQGESSLLQDMYEGGEMNGGAVLDNLYDLNLEDQAEISQLVDNYCDLRGAESFFSKERTSDVRGDKQPSGKHLLQRLKGESEIGRKELFQLQEANLKLENEISFLELEEVQTNSELNHWETVAFHTEQELKKLERAAEVLRVEDEGLLVADKILKLQGLVEKRRTRINRIKSEWEDVKGPLEEKKESLSKELRALKVEDLKSEAHIGDLEGECQSTEKSISERDDDLTEVSEILRSHEGRASRSAFLRRINDVVKNVRRQEAVIRDIRSDTRDSHRQLNDAEEKLKRIYAIIEDILFREAKVDATLTHTYRQLTKFHETFHKMVESVRETSKTERETMELERKLISLRKQNFDVSALNKDLLNLRQQSQQKVSSKTQV